MSASPASSMQHLSLCWWMERMGAHPYSNIFFPTCSSHRLTSPSSNPYPLWRQAPIPALSSSQPTGSTAIPTSQLHRSLRPHGQPPHRRHRDAMSLRGYRCWPLHRPRHRQGRHWEPWATVQRRRCLWPHGRPLCCHHRGASDGRWSCYELSVEVYQDDIGVLLEGYMVVLQSVSRD
jgi:hypothetical protein